MKIEPTFLQILSLSIALGFHVRGQESGMERQPSYAFAPVNELPVQTGLADPFLKPDGTRVKSREEWAEQRRYLKAMLAHYQYGVMPPRPQKFDLTRIDSEEMSGGKEIRERYSITLRRNGESVAFEFELIRPPQNKRYPAVIKNDRGLPPGKADRAAASDGVSRGYLVCFFNRQQLASDDKESSRKGGVYPLYPEYDWGAIAVWAWAHGIVADALDRLQLADMDRLIYTGHSRGGKTALCAGIYDERVAITAPNSSGAGGTGSLRYFEKGKREQRIRHHAKHFPHWWGKRFYEFSRREDRLPFDAHIAKALIAPRGLINAHARQDYWANPYGTELTYRAADRVFDWLGAKGMQGIHWRNGGHNQGKEDWAALFDFADLKFFNKKPKRSFSTLTYPDAEVPAAWKAPSDSSGSKLKGDVNP